MLQQIVVNATSGRPTGSRASRRLRAQGQIPGVIYGLGRDPRPVSVEYTSLRSALTTSAGMNAVFTLDLEGDQEMVLVRDVQRDPIKRLVTHADFLRIDPDQRIRVSVPIELVGEPTEVLEAGGIIEQNIFEIEVEVAPGAIPDSIQADVSELTLDGRISVADLVLPDTVTTLLDGAISVVAPVVTRASKIDDDEEGGELDLDGEEVATDDAEDAEGDSGAADEE